MQLNYLLNFLIPWSGLLQLELDHEIPDHSPRMLIRTQNITISAREDKKVKFINEKHQRANQSKATNVSSVINATIQTKRYFKY